MHKSQYSKVGSTLTPKLSVRKGEQVLWPVGADLPRGWKKVRKWSSLRVIILIVVLGLLAMILGAHALRQRETPTPATQPPKTGHSIEKTGAVGVAPTEAQLCGLTVVICQNEPRLPVIRERPVKKAKSALRVVTAYNTTKEQTDASPCIAASGVNICDGMKRGKRYVATNELKFGTKVRIAGEVYEVVDRTSPQHPHRYDIAFDASSIQEAKNWGSRLLAVEVMR